MGAGPVRSVGWIAVLLVCAAAFLALTFRVNAVRSEVKLAERRIVALERQRRYYEVEFQVRANQHQLADWNRVEFGYQAPGAGQFIPDQRALAALGAPRAPGAPAPIEVARAPAVDGDGGFPAMVSPLTGQAMARTPDPDSTAGARHRDAGTLADRLARSETRALPDAEPAERDRTE